MKTAVARACADAAIDPGAVDYIETHGMSSALADGAELAALGAGLRSQDDGADDGADDGPDGGAHVTYLGSVKPCIGHTEVVSGLAALVKTAQAMRHGVIPALPGFGRLHPDLSSRGRGCASPRGTCRGPSAPTTPAGRCRALRACTASGSAV
ncbi:hypothetical protein ACFQ60_46640 [Streptomyces zhihengii]